ncbi:hypothetical protein ACVWY5_005072 [Bradyrhizobium sp. USDA 3256]
MHKRRHMYRARDLASELMELEVRMREMVAKGVDALKVPVPDTFLGRKTYEPFPQEESQCGEGSLRKGTSDPVGT